VADRVWLITGASSGFGRAIADAALAREDSVVATARSVEALDGLAPRERVHREEAASRSAKCRRARSAAR
jgi:NAD(P)-dependent dehydrogenase (short-subunit alcohol dehydrogenase family)